MWPTSTSPTHSGRTVIAANVWATARRPSSWRANPMRALRQQHDQTGRGADRRVGHRGDDGECCQDRLRLQPSPEHVADPDLLGRRQDQPGADGLDDRDRDRQQGHQGQDLGPPDRVTAAQHRPARSGCDGQRPGHCPPTQRGRDDPRHRRATVAAKPAQRACDADRGTGRRPCAQQRGRPDQARGQDRGSAVAWSEHEAAGDHRQHAPAHQLPGAEDVGQRGHRRGTQRQCTHNHGRDARRDHDPHG